MEILLDIQGNVGVLNYLCWAKKLQPFSDLVLISCHWYDQNMLYLQQNWRSSQTLLLLCVAHSGSPTTLYIYTSILKMFHTANTNRCKHVNDWYWPKRKQVTLHKHLGPFCRFIDCSSSVCTCNERVSLKLSGYSAAHLETNQFLQLGVFLKPLVHSWEREIMLVMWLVNLSAWSGELR